MNLTDFFDKVDAHPELEGIGIDGADGKAAVIVRHRSTRLTTRIPAKAVEKADQSRSTPLGCVWPGPMRRTRLTAGVHWATACRT